MNFCTLNMYLKNLSLINFKNYAQAELTFSSHINCFTGSNGEGKTNLLDAIHYLSFCKSFFNPIDSQNIMHDEPFFVVQGTFINDENKEEEIYCGQKRGQKKQFKKNKKEYDRLADHIGLFPLVMVSPADTELITEGSESRRKFIDNVISQFDREYLNDLISYNRVLSHRNALLKQFAVSGSFDATSLEIWDVQLISLGEKIHLKRKKFITDFSPGFADNYNMISEAKESVAIAYHSQLNEISFAETLKKAINKDRVLEHTTAGIHKDDIDFIISGFPAKKYGSQGQQKTYLIALKLAQFEFIKKIKNITPILLLDDIHDKLDEKRMMRLMKLVSGENFGQIFITDTHEKRLRNFFNQKEVMLFTVKNGNVENIAV